MGAVGVLKAAISATCVVAKGRAGLGGNLNCVTLHKLIIAALYSPTSPVLILSWLMVVVGGVACC